MVPCEGDIATRVNASTSEMFARASSFSSWRNLLCRCSTAAIGTFRFEAGDHRQTDRAPADPRTPTSSNIRSNGTPGWG